MDAGSAGAVDQDVEATQLGNRFLGDFLRAFHGACVAGDEGRALRGLGVGVARGDDDCCAAVKLRGGRADAARAARNQGALADELFCEV